MSNTTRIPLDHGHVDVDYLAEHVEVTVRINDRTVFGIALSPVEAEQIGMALARPDGVTVTDVFHVADALNVDAADLIASRNA